MRRSLTRLLLQSSTRGFSSTSFSTSLGFAGLEHELSVVSHTPVFSHLVSRLFLTDKTRGNEEEPLQILDMTFGAGGHSDMLLNHQLSDRVGTLVVCDCDRIAHNEAKDLRARKGTKVFPLKSRFAQLPNLLLDNGFHPGTFDGILIDVAGCSPQQWADQNRGFCPNKAGSLDLRYDPEVSSNRPTASQVLQNITDRDLIRLIKSYSGLGPNRSKYAANAIVEARYMFHKFKTTQELYEVMRTAARTYCMEKQSRVETKALHHGHQVSPIDELSESQLCKRFMREVVTALQLFVNDGPNELHFAIQSVARNFLKPPQSGTGHGGGTLIAIVDTDAESRVAQSCLREADTVLLDQGRIDNVQLGSGRMARSESEEPCRPWLPWTMVHEDELTAAEKTLYPRLENSKLYSATLNQ